jgi:hypothetical protein
MDELAPKRKREIVIDADWMTAVTACIFLAFCMLSIAVGMRKVLAGAPVNLQLRWESVLGLAMSAWLAFQFRERLLRFLLGALAASIASKGFLKLIHASLQLQVVNAEIMRVVDLIAMTVFCLYAFRYLKPRIKFDDEE